MVCQGKHGSNRNTVENTHGIPIGSLSITPDSIINWLKSLVSDAPPRLDAGVLEDLTGFARLGNSLEN